MSEQTYRPNYTGSHALLIGIDAYPPAFPPLGTAVKGVREMADVLQSELGFKREQIVTLVDAQATQRAILRALNDPLSRRDKVGPDDRVLIYFAGHGVTFDTAEGEIGCIVPHDAEPGDVYTTIEMDRLTRLANRIYAKHVLFLIDACFSGFATVREMAPGVERQVSDLLIRRARQVITAGMREQTVSDFWGPGGHSLFTGFLLDGLRGAAPMPGGVLRAFHLAGYLQDQVAQHSQSLQSPQYASLMGSQGGDFILSVREVIELPRWVVEAAGSDDPTQRLFAVGQLHALAQDQDKPEMASQALAKLQELAGDPSVVVASSAQAALHELMPETEVAPVKREEPVVVEPEPTPLRARRGIRPLWVGIGVAALVGVVIGGLVISGLLGGKPTPAPTETPLSPGFEPVTSNDDWTPVIERINGVGMALVPAGCFMMGSEDNDNEKPVHKVCFDEPFWIDVYEVTNKQYGSEGYFSGSTRPRESVTWPEAVTHCESRGARLPTEAEWEYAARGPDGLVYPWGNVFVPDNVVYYDNSNSYTWGVGSKPDGISWVGAFDMSGNVEEWMSTWYAPYPYDAADGREERSNPGSYDGRVLRGGSWHSDSSYLCAANRSRYYPVNTWTFTGFRCARSY